MRFEVVLDLRESKERAGDAGTVAIDIVDIVDRSGLCWLLPLRELWGLRDVIDPRSDARDPFKDTIDPLSLFSLLFGEPWG